MSRFSLIAAIALMTALLACSQGEDPGNQVSASDSISQVKSPVVANVEVRDSVISEDEVEVWISGILPDTCSRINSVTQQQDGDTFWLVLTAEAIDRGDCEQDKRVEFIEIVPIPTDGLESGLYFVWAGDLGATFEVE